MSEEIKNWYVLKVISGKEKKIKHYIENEISRLDLSNNISKILIPIEKVFQIRNGKKIAKEKNIFPGYILIEANLVGEIPHIIKNIPGVLGFLEHKENSKDKSGDKKKELKAPTPIRSSEINKILGKIDEVFEKEDYVSFDFIVGETVKVIDGPFNSFSGTIEEINEEKKKVKVIVKIFGRKTPLELSFLQIEKE